MAMQESKWREGEGGSFKLLLNANGCCLSSSDTINLPWFTHLILFRESSPSSSPVKKEVGLAIQGQEAGQREEIVQETHDEIEKFIAEMEKDQEL